MVQSLNSPLAYFENVTGGEFVPRLVSWLILSFAFYSYGTNPALYIISIIFVWLLAVFIMEKIVRKTLGKRCSLTFAVMAPFPFFSSSIFYNAYYFAEYGFSILFMSLHLLLIYYYVVRGNILTYWFSYAFLILSMLCLSIILPFLLISVFLPILLEIEREKQSFIRITLGMVKKYIAPVFVICTVFVFLKLFGPKGSAVEEIYGLYSLDIKSVLQAAYYFLVLIVEIPVMLFEVIPYSFSLKGMLITLLVISYLLLVNYGDSRSEISKDLMNSKRLTMAKLFAISLSSGSLIFLISAYPATSFGFYTKMMIPAFMIWSILLSFIITNTLRNSSLKFVGMAAIVLGVNSMNVQLENFVHAWQLRTVIYNDISTKLEENDITEDILLIANVPFFLDNNYNNEEIVFMIGNFDAGLKYSGVTNVNAWPICWRILNERTFYPAHNLLTQKNRIDMSKKMWYYQYSSHNELASSLTAIQDQQALGKVLTEARNDSINYHTVITREKMRKTLMEASLVRRLYNSTIPNS